MQIKIEWYDNDLIEEEEYKSKRRELLDSM